MTKHGVCGDPVGRSKVRLELNRQVILVARCATERLMRQLGLQEVRHGRKIRITVPGRDAPGLPSPEWLGETAR